SIKSVCESLSASWAILLLTTFSSFFMFVGQMKTTEKIFYELKLFLYRIYFTIPYRIYFTIPTLV
ncbi:MAG: hypothetical protein O4807_16760, partial [Trichodesmium sp. St19_bin2]|nr:hypothetical protein [Trichodesmium sp. St19_bin2]